MSSMNNKSVKAFHEVKIIYIQNLPNQESLTASLTTYWGWIRFHGGLNNTNPL